VGAARRGLESSIICGVRRQAFEGLVERNPTLGTRVTRVLGERLIETEGRLAGVVRKEVPERLASQILCLVESEGVVTRVAYRILTRYTSPAIGHHDRCQPGDRHPAFREVALRGGVELRNRRILVTGQEALKRATYG
jgi:CRP-like cAMP-binding protein